MRQGSQGCGARIWLLDRRLDLAGQRRSPLEGLGAAEIRALCAYAPGSAATASATSAFSLAR